MVLAIEEFSADDCHCLSRVLTYIVEATIEIFRTDGIANGIEPGSSSGSGSVNPEVTVHEFVGGWLKFRELVSVLGFGLQQVADRWSDGKGPLALYFTGEQVAQLVIAMFEKTSKRDALVSQLQLCRQSLH